MKITVQFDMPEDLKRMRLPAGVQKRMQYLLDKQDSGGSLSASEKEEAEGLVDLAEHLTLLRLRAERES